tara:strand:+ start:390 stop:578 length:189 start_codon:yes stop_codon:yes gene_type:complete
MDHIHNAIDNDIFAHFRQEKAREEEAIQLLKDNGYIVYKRSTKSPRIYENLGVSKKIQYSEI